MTGHQATLRAGTTRHQRGQGFVLLSLFLVVLLGLVALGVDGGSLYLNRRQVQNAADAAALAGAFTMARGDPSSPTGACCARGTDIRAAIDTYASANYIDSSSTNVSAYYVDSTPARISGASPPADPPAAAVGVEVVATKQAQTFFMPIIGFNNLKVDAIAAAHGTPSAPGGPGYGLFAREPGKPNGAKVIDWSGSSWTVTGTVHSNSDVNMCGSSNTINGDVEDVSGVNPSGLVGHATLNPANTPTDPNPVGSTALPDPVNKTLTDFYQGTTSTSTYHYIDMGGTGTTNLSTYITSGVLQSGVYYVNGNINLAALSATTPSTVTLVTTGYIKSSQSIDLLPFDSGKMLFFANISKSTAPGGVGLEVSSPSGAWNGIAYAPNSAVKYSGSSSLIAKGSIVAYDINLSGSHGNLTCDPSFFGTPSIAKIFLYK